MNTFMKRIIHSLIVAGLLITVSCAPVIVTEIQPATTQATIKNVATLPNGVMLGRFMTITRFEVWDYGDSQTSPVYTFSGTINPDGYANIVLPVGMHYMKVITAEGITKISTGFNFVEGKEYNVVFTGCYEVVGIHPYNDYLMAVEVSEK